MPETRTTTFRLPVEDLENLARLAEVAGISRTSLITEALELVGAVLDGAGGELARDVAALRERYGDALVKIYVTENSDGSPNANLLVDEKPVDDASAHAYLDPSAGEAVVFLEVERTNRTPALVTLGSQLVSITRPGLAFGRIKWPPRQVSVIALDLGSPEVAHLLQQLAQEQVIPAEPIKASLQR